MLKIVRFYDKHRSWLLGSLILHEEARTKKGSQAYTFSDLSSVCIRYQALPRRPSMPLKSLSSVYCLCSALDAESEKVVQEALDHVTKGMFYTSSFTVCHTFETVEQLMISKSSIHHTGEPAASKNQPVMFMIISKFSKFSRHSMLDIKVSDASFMY